MTEISLNASFRVFVSQRCSFLDTVCLTWR